jgi:hypothetical protein
VLRATGFRRPLPAFRVRSGVSRAPGTGFRSRTPRGIAAVTVVVLLLANLILVYRLGDEDIPASVISPGGTRGAVEDNRQPFAANLGDALEDIRASIMADIQAVSKPVIEEGPERRGPERDRPSVAANGRAASATTTTSTGTAASSSSTSSSSSGSGSTTSDTSDPAGGGSNGDTDGTTDDTGASGGGAGGGGGTNGGDAEGNGSSGAGGGGGG